MLVLVLGGLGAGKTLLLALIALMDDRPIWSNFAIKDDRYNELTPSGIDTLDRSVALMDEGYVWIESRVSSSLINRIVSQVLFQSRKRKTDIAVSAQLEKTLDVRFRDMADYIIVAERGENEFIYHVFEQGSDQEVGTMCIDYEDAPIIWDLYDTDQKISRTSIYQLAEIENDPIVLNKLVEELADKIVAALPDQKIQGWMIEDFCLRLGVPNKFAKWINNRLRSRGLYEGHDECPESEVEP